VKQKKIDLHLVSDLVSHKKFVWYGKSHQITHILVAALAGKGAPVIDPIGGWFLVTFRVAVVVWRVLARWPNY